MTPSPALVSCTWDFLQHNPLLESYACAKVPNEFSHLKLTTHDSSSDPKKHIM